MKSNRLYAFVLIAFMLIGCSKNNDSNLITLVSNDYGFSFTVDKELQDSNKVVIRATSDIEEVQKELDEAYKTISENSGTPVEYDYRQTYVGSTYIHIINISDNNEHKVIYENSSYSDYSQTNYKICVITVEDGMQPVFNEYELAESLEISMKGCSYIFYGYIENPEDSEK